MRPWPAGWSAVVATAALGCSGAWHAESLPSPVSAGSVGTGGFRAGAARVDITPPPGVGLGGSGPEGARSTGYRTRLYLNAIVLEDAEGERIALVVADLAHVSANLHRLAAERLLRTTGLGADRLIVSATHTHSGPAHFYGERQYNANVSRVAGYDPRIRDFLVRQIVTAVTRAAGDLAPAVAATGTTAISGVSWNRSLEAFCQNENAAPTEVCRTGQAGRAIDSMLFMLRVDRLAPATGRREPLASYSVFSIHGTAVPTINTLLDGDLHVRVVRRLAAHADALGGGGTVHALANGNEGDAAPRVARACGVAQLEPDPVPMPKGPSWTVDFRPPSRAVAAACLDRAIDEVDQLAGRIAASAIGLYDRLGAGLTAAVPVRRAFTTAWLPGVDGLCNHPELGSATAAGAEGAETRVRGWRWLAWPIVFGFEEGGKARSSRSSRCQEPKRPLLDPFQTKLIVGEYGFPETAQLAVVRVGDALLGAVPAEVTTVAGKAIRDSMAAAFPAAGWRPAHSVLIGLANGFLQYVTTAAEYRWQAYEGGSNLYGAETGSFLARRLAELARELAPGGPSPPPNVGAITAYPGPPSEIVALPAAPPAEAPIERIALRCTGGRLTAEWIDLAPGRILPREDSWVWLMVGEDPSPRAVDGDGRLEIRLLGKRGAAGYRWQARWLDRPEPGRRYRVERREGNAVVGTSPAVECRQ